MKITSIGVNQLAGLGNWKSAGAECPGLMGSLGVLDTRGLFGVSYRAHENDDQCGYNRNRSSRRLRRYA